MRENLYMNWITKRNGVRRERDGVLIGGRVHAVMVGVVVEGCDGDLDSLFLEYATCGHLLQGDAGALWWDR